MILNQNSDYKNSETFFCYNDLRIVISMVYIFSKQRCTLFLDNKFLFGATQFEGLCYGTNLDSILKSKDITLPTKVCLVKAMVFPVVMYGCESWTVTTSNS